MSRVPSRKALICSSVFTGPSSPPPAASAWRWEPIATIARIATIVHEPLAALRNNKQSQVPIKLKIHCGVVRLCRCGIGGWCWLSILSRFWNLTVWDSESSSLAVLDFKCLGLRCGGTCFTSYDGETCSICCCTWWILNTGAFRFQCGVKDWRSFNAIQLAMS